MSSLSIGQQLQSYVSPAIDCIDGGVQKLAGSVYSVAVNTLNVVAEVVEDPDALAKVFRGAGYVLYGLKECGVVVLTVFETRATEVVSLIDLVQIFGDLKYFATCGWRETEDKESDGVPYILGRVALAAADVGGVVLWVQEIGFDLASIAAKAIGRGRVFVFIMKVPLGTIITAFVGFGFAFLGADAIRKLWLARNQDDPDVNIRRVNALIDLGTSAIEVAGKVLVIAIAVSIVPATPVVCVVIAVLGVAAAGFGLTSFAFRVYYRDRLNKVVVNNNVNNE